MKKIVTLLAIAAMALSGCKNALLEGRMAAYEEPGYVVQIETRPGGRVEITPKKDSYKAEEQIKIEAEADEGYWFKEWQGNTAGSDNPLIVKVSEDMWIIAKFEEVLKYRLTTEWLPIGGVLYYSYDGIFDTTVEKIEFLPGEQCAVRAAPAAGYQFDGWEGDIETVNDTIYIRFDRDYQVYPKFSIIPTPVTYTITAAASTGGGIDFYPFKAAYYENEIVMVTAESGGGYIFDRWTGDHMGNEVSFNLVMDGDKNIGAVFIKREWTFLIYMAADNDLDGVALSDFNEMEAVDYSGKPFTVLALVDRINAGPGNWSGTRLYEIKSDPDGKNAVIVSTRLSGTPELNISGGADSELDTSNRQVLSGFIDYGKREYSADNYGLILWGYGLGWKGCAVDDTSGSSMSLSSLRNAVEGKGLKVIGFDTDFGVTLEAAYELRNSAQYLAGSPGTVSDPQKGWDYQILFNDFISKPNKTAEVFSGCIVEQYRRQYGMSNGASISIADLSKTALLFTAFENFSGALAGTLTDIGGRDALYTKMVNGTVQLYYDGTEFPADAYADLYSMSLQGDGAALRGALDGAVSSWSKEFGTARPLMGVFVNTLTSSAVFAASHAAGYRKNQGTILFATDSGNYVPSGSSGGTGLLDKLFYYTY
jgi:hypothetical protein